MQRTDAPAVKDLVLIGGGHSHVAVLKSFGMRPMPGVRVTLVCKDVYTPYSGMLPGYLAGHYSFADTHIDLRPLCNFAGAQFYHGQVIGLDLNRKQILCADRPPARFDLLSINIGSTPNTKDVPGAREHSLRVKPIDLFLRSWEELLARLQKAKAETGRVAVVGGGAGGVELALSTQHRLQRWLDESQQGTLRLEYHLVTASPTILPTHNRRVQEKFDRILRERDVRVHLGHQVRRVEPGRLLCDPGQAMDFDVLFWVTNASAPSWLAESGLKTDAEGFVAVNDRLQSVSHQDVFAAGDIATVQNHPRPKSGVFAVRQGPPLARNLRAALAGQPPEPFAPQRRFLSLISTGDQYAVASRGQWSVEGAWVWRWKDWIDRRWMRRYQVLPEMSPPSSASLTEGLADEAALREMASTPMRCGGCGAKVGSAVLTRVLQRLRPIQRDDVVVGLNSPDDAAVITVPPGKVSVQTVDFFRSFINDPFVFGKVTANHCLGDIFAMGAAPQSALAIVTVPYGAEDTIEEQIFQVMSGAADVLAAHQTALAGGHTAEGPELAFGLVVNGIADPNRLLRKAGMQPGDRLILTKPLGTGALFAADMRRKAAGHWIEAAVKSMLTSNQAAARCLLGHGATACTDVTGFGLLGHLMEMVKQAPVNVELQLNEMPVLEGAVETIRAGILSSLQPQNVRLRRAIRNLDGASNHERFPLLFDPQTAGGLLASVPSAGAEACLAELRRSGCDRAAVIGSATAAEDRDAPVRITV
ncbi:MAG TPA: selenide, water dikinase SelD [Verrucomicrobiae bacterium]|nr:selenide, water dikinase SelD [Verrucomicrobiae bacterium]